MSVGQITYLNMTQVVAYGNCYSLIQTWCKFKHPACPCPLELSIWASATFHSLPVIMETVGVWTAGIIVLKTEHVLWIRVIVQNEEGWAINLYIVIVRVIERMSFKFVFYSVKSNFCNVSIVLRINAILTMGEKYVLFGSYRISLFLLLNQFMGQCKI